MELGKFGVLDQEEIIRMANIYGAGNCGAFTADELIGSAIADLPKELEIISPAMLGVLAGKIINAYINGYCAAGASVDSSKNTVFLDREGAEYKVAEIVAKCHRV